MTSNSTARPVDDQKACGQQLREGREAAGLSLEDVAARLRMPVQVVRSLEQEDWQRLDAPVFVRGQLRSYARLLGLNLDAQLNRAVVASVEPPELVSHTHTPRLRRILESATRRAVYVVMTGVLAVPVWYASRSHFDSGAPRTASLDVVPAETADAPARVAPASQERPVRAPYIASIAALPHGAPQASSAAAEVAALTLRFNADSWIKVSAPDGGTIEQMLAKAGEQRRYSPGQVGHVLLGNAAAVEVQQAGSIVDIKPFQRANVARFAVSSDGSVVPASE